MRIKMALFVFSHKLIFCENESVDYFSSENSHLPFINSTLVFIFIFFSYQGLYVLVFKTKQLPEGENNF